MEFKDWLGPAQQEIYDAYEYFLDSVLSEHSGINECGCDAITAKGEFVLEEARKPRKETPWGSETWLDSNPKIEKTKGVNSFKMKGKRLVFEPYLINLLPAKQSGINLCICATKHCAATCLHTAGNVGALMDKTMARLRKSWFIALDRDRAFAQIVNQIENKKQEVDDFNRKSKDEHKQMIIRLNGTSDLIWRVLVGKDGRNLFDMFPDIVFYDYSKDQNEMDHFIRGEIIDEEGNNLGKFPSNYHLTLSYGGPGGNVASYRNTLIAGENLAVPFGPGKAASLDYMEFPRDMRELMKTPKKKDRIYFPDHVGTGKAKESRKQKDAYIDSIIEKIKESGDYVSPEELAPFAGQTLLPGLFMCHEVIDGDDYDARFLDDLMLPRMNRPNYSDSDPDMEIDRWGRSRKRHGVVVGLTAKGDLTYSAYKGIKGWDLNHTGFMVGPSDPEMNNSCSPRLNDPSKEAFLRKKTEVFKKVARAIMTIRNFDARHIHAHDKDEEGNQRTHVKRGGAKPVQTYLSAKGRTTKEMNDLIDVIQAVMKGQTPSIQGSRDGKMIKVAAAAAKLRTYLTDPETIHMLNDEEFKRQARRFGIDVNFESLSKLVDMDTRRDPEGPKRTLLPRDTLMQMTRSPEQQS